MHIGTAGNHSRFFNHLAETGVTALGHFARTAAIQKQKALRDEAGSPRGQKDSDDLSTKVLCPGGGGGGGGTIKIHKRIFMRQVESYM